MPELPDVELFGRRIEGAALGRRIEKAAVLDARILDELSAEAFCARVQGATIAGIRRHGKHLLVRLAGDRPGWITLHFGMTGTIEASDDGGTPPRFTRVLFELSGGRRLAYVNARMLGKVGVADDAERFIRGQGLGPDALDRGFDLARFRASFGGRRQGIKAALMDQSLMAGVGNIYADEILFQARLHPGQRLDRLDARTLAMLFRTLRKVLATAIRCGAGSEMGAERLPAGFLLRDRRQGAPCPRCGRPIRSFKVSGRTAYFCARCQAPGRG